MDTSKFKSHLEDCGYETREYSGRGMYGEQCLAVVTDDSAFVFCANVMNEDEEETRNELANILHATKEDSMGRSSIIFYWPRMKVGAAK